MVSYKITRLFKDYPGKRVTVKRGLTLEEAQAHCSDPETSSRTATSRVAKSRTRHKGEWFDAYESEE